MKISEAASQKIKNMSLLCAMLVVAIHVPWPSEMPLSLGWLIDKGVKGGIARIAVPFFFVISGFFLVQHLDEHGWWKRETAKRIKSLVVPFVIWSLAYVLATIPLSVIADIIAHRPFGTSICIMKAEGWPLLFGFDLTEFPMHVPLWYVRCLFLFVLSAGAFKWVVDRWGCAWLAIAFAFALVQNHIPNENWRQFFRMGYSASGIFYFSVGIMIGPRKFKMLGSKPAFACTAIGVMLLIAKMVFAYHGWRGEIAIGKLSLPFLIYAVWHYMSAARWPAWLTSCSFPIFLIHPIMLSYAGVAVKHLYTTEPSVNATTAQYCCGVVLSIIAAVVMRRLAPKAAAIAFGGR